MIVRERAAPVEGPAAGNGVDRAVRPIIVLTFLPFLWKAVSYALLDSYLPLAVFLALGAAVAAGLHVGGRWARWAVRLWCTAMIAWATARLGLLVLVPLSDLSEAHARSQLTVSFAAVSVLYLVVGAVLWRRVRLVRG